MQHCLSCSIAGYIMLNRQKVITASARTALSATDNNSTTSDNNSLLHKSYSAFTERVEMTK